MRCAFYFKLLMTLHDMALCTMLLPGQRSWEESWLSSNWSSPITQLPPDHASFTDDPQVNFSSLSSSSTSACDVSALPSTVQIVDLELQDPPTDDEMT